MVENKKFKIISVVCTFLLLILANISLVFASGNYDRIQGVDRYDTSRNILSKVSSKSGYAIIVTGEDYADALCSAPLSKKYDAPIILVNGKKLEDKTVTELKNRNITNVFIIGGQSVISQNIEDSLNDLKINCERIYGQTRYETSVKIAEHLDFSGNIVVTTGKNFPDALSIAPIAAIKNMPILLVDEKGGNEKAFEYLKDKQIDKTYIIGGTGVISDNAEMNFKNSYRIKGKDRYETNDAIINEFKGELNFDNLYISTGNNFPDALSGTALIQGQSAPLLLIDDNISAAQQNSVKGKVSMSKSVHVLGGEGAVNLKALYLAGIEKTPPPEPVKPKVEPPKPTVPQAPKRPSSMAVINAPETTAVSILSSPSSNAKSLGSIYGSLAEVKYLGKEGNYYKVEFLDYDTLNVKKGYVQASKVKWVNITSTYSILVDLKGQKVYVYNNDVLVKQIRCSSGAEQTPTPPGRFIIGSKGPYFYANENVICYFWTRFNNNFLFHSVLYDKTGYAIKSEYDKLGQKASHGCVRLPYEEAEWINKNIPVGTLVVVQ